jgi:outer membrane lipoprotein-sorting protein
MKVTHTIMRHKIVAALCLLALALPLLITAGPLAATPDKMKPEEVVAKHLESIGTAEARAKIKSRIIQGTAQTTFRVGGKGQAEGGAVLASTGDKSLISIVYGTQEYPFDRMGFDGKILTVSDIKPGVRSTLAKFLMAHEMMFKEGLIGGTLSSAWPLLDMSTRNAKLKYAGTKSVNNRKAHVLEYDSKNNAGLKTLLFFDTETFQHVRTEYEQRLVQQMPDAPGVTQQQGDSIQKVVEEFADFKPEEGLMLPHAYTLQLSIEAVNRRSLQDWAFTLSKFNFNIPIDDKEFDVRSSNKTATE